MNTRLTALAAAIALLSAPTFAASALELYGKVNVSVQNTSDDSQNNSEGAKRWEVKSNASRIGVKGELTVSDETVAFYTFEWEVDSADNAGVKQDNTNKVTGENFKSRNQFVGLKGGFGAVMAGRTDTPFKVAQNKVDLFNDYDGDMKALFNGETRANNLFQYSTPQIGGMFKLNVATLMQEKYDTDASATDDSQDGLFDATSISAEFEVTKDLFLAVALDNNHKTGSYHEDAKSSRIVAQYKLGDFQLGAILQSYDDGADFNEKGRLISVAYKASENGTLKLQHGTSDIVATGGKQTSFGYDHKLAKNVSLFTWYTKQDEDADNKAKAILAGGIEVKF